MTTYLLDTNTVSELRRPRPSPQAIAWYEAQRSDDLFTSVVAVGEMRRGVELMRRRDLAQAEALDVWLSGVLRGFGERVLPVTGEIAEVWGRFQGERGPLAVADCYLAATARVHGMTLATRNVKDMARTGVDIVNPFECEGD
ncbi:type II toxin-antitoxin system VapC family toxin [Streptomyces sp. NPDC002790]|uniref:type II toxin-antitoxin system VapC family toxin n=1 Tax=Streptomyces sp. NPDC002790 TaxID=3154431 RepID=UPI00331860FA